MRRGFTLVELLVVLVLMGLAFGLVAPALRTPDPPEESALAPLVRAGRAAAIRRGEATLLVVARDGSWRVQARASDGEPPLATGRVPPPARAFTITFSPLGTCAGDIASGAGDELPLDLLDCGLLRQ